MEIRIIPDEKKPLLSERKAKVFLWGSN